ncbi:MAG: DMT family transporter [Parachlamydiaceae bacterium]
MAYVYLMISIIAETIATLSMNSSRGFTVWGPSLVVVTGYMIAFYCLSLTLNEIPVGIVYATWSGLGIVIVSLGGYFLQNQPLDHFAILGMIFIILGVLLLNLLSHSSAH